MERIASGDHHVSYKLGALTLTSLRDGYVDMPVTRLRKPQNTIFETDLPPQIPLVDGKLRLSVNAFALDDGEWVSLIDTGASNAWLPSMGCFRKPCPRRRLRLSGFERSPSPTRISTISTVSFSRMAGTRFLNCRRLLVPKAELALFRAEARREHQAAPLACLTLSHPFGEENWDDCVRRHEHACPSSKGNTRYSCDLCRRYS